MTVAAVALPMPKLMMVMPPAVALVMGLLRPWTGTRCQLANSST